MPIINYDPSSPLYGIRDNDGSNHHNPFIGNPVAQETPVMPQVFINQFGDATECTQDNCAYCYTSPDSEYVSGLDRPRNSIDGESGRNEDVSLANASDIGCECGACHIKKRGYDDTLRARSIGSYHDSPPGGWVGRRASSIDEMRYYIGVELETDIDYGGDRGVRDYAADMARPVDHWIAKHDGSVGGPEFASQPATLQWWRNHNKSLEEMFRMLLHAGYRSYDGGRAGMHVNISRSAFDTADHFFRFLRLTHIRPDWSCVMAQRTTQQAQQWAQFTNMGNSIREWKRWAQEHFDNNGAYYEKYSALNAPAHQDRFEFRLPRGTLRLDRFMKNIEWTVSMIEYVRTMDDDKEANPTSYMKSLIGNRRFPNLIGFMNERADSLFSVAA